MARRRTELTAGASGPEGVKGLSTSLSRRAVLGIPLAVVAVSAVQPVGAASAADAFGAYLMVHFTGESADGEQIYFATSGDGLHWTDLNASHPVLLSNVGENGVRDPSIIRSPSGDKFFIIATDLRIANGKGWGVAQHSGSRSLVVWESSDLVNWSAPRLVDVASGIPDAGCAWAPEAIWDPSTKSYFVYWTTISPSNGVDKPRVYYSYTSDFRSFTAPKLYIERSGSQGIIDTQIIDLGTSASPYRYIRASGDGQITIEGSNTLLGTWTRVGDLSGLGLTGSDVEGPMMHKYNDRNEWALWVDQYATGRGYLPIVSTNLASTSTYRARATSEYSLGADRKRHGFILPTTSAQDAALQSRWGSGSIRRLQSFNYPDRYVRHTNFDVRIDPSPDPVVDSQFHLVPGLSTTANGAVSIESVNFPGYYLRHSAFDFSLVRNDGSAQFAADATFVEVAGLADSSKTSFRSVNFTDRYIRHSAFQLRLDTINSTSARQDATFIKTQ